MFKIVNPFREYRDSNICSDFKRAILRNGFLSYCRN